METKEAFNIGPITKNQMSKGLIIVETRPKVGLVETVKNHLKYLDGWTPLIFYSKANEDELWSSDIESFMGIRLENTELNAYKYNRMITSPLFWDLLPFYKVLITQTDARMLRKGIEEFIQYDYVGSPWTFSEWGGNGGFSLRTVSVMKKICEEFRYDMSMDGNEDIFFCKIMNNLGKGKLAPREICEQFSCESIFKLGTLGYHAADKYVTPEQFQQLINQYK